MKTVTGLFLLILSHRLWAQGVMPVPSEVSLAASSCKQEQNFTILSDPLLSPFKINLSSLICDENSLFGDAFSASGPVQHNRVRCDEIGACSSGVSADDLKDADALISQHIPTVVYLSALTKAVEENKAYNQALRAYERKHKTKVCEEEAIDFDCDHQMRMALAAVADSLVDYPEFDRAPASKDNLVEFIPAKFFSARPAGQLSLESLKKDCSKKLSVKKVCEQARQRIVAVKSCDESADGKNCFDEEQKAWASLTNDFKSSNKQLYLALEKQLCLPQRVTKSSSQTTFQAYTPLLFRLPSSVRTRTSADSGQSRTQSLLTTARLNAGMEKPHSAELADNKDSTEQKTQESTNDEASNRPSTEGLKKATNSIALDDSLRQVANSNHSPDTIHAADGPTFADTVGESMKEVIDQTGRGLNTNNNANNNSNAWNTDIINRARELAEEQRLAAEEEKRLSEEKKKSEQMSDAEKKKQGEIDKLMAQIDTLKSKLEDMTERVDDLKKKKDKDETKSEASAESSETEKAIVELKKKIAELEADKKRKEEEARVARVVEANRLQKEQEKNQTAPSAYATTPGSSYVHAGKPAEVAADSAALERDKAARAPASNYGAEVARGPASVASAGASANATPQLVLKAIGTQATPESSIVYMTPNELQRYPYRLNDNASPTDIEKMLEGNQGSTIIIGESEQIVPLTENGKIVLDENGKIKYKRIKIALVKNEKERKQQIAREISSLADLKREEQKKRDLIRYQEMKKALKLKE